MTGAGARGVRPAGAAAALDGGTQGVRAGTPDTDALPPGDPAARPDWRPTRAPNHWPGGIPARLAFANGPEGYRMA